MTDVPSAEAGFTNRVLALSSQPSIYLRDFEPLEPRLLRARNVLTLVIGLILTSAALAAALVLDIHRWIGLVGVVVVAALTVVVMLATRISFGFWGYLVREQDLTVRHGVLNRAVTSVSFNRVQHASVSSGPLERWLGLATLRVYTAGGVGADITVEGLAQDDATKLQQLILTNVAAAGQSIAPFDR